MREIYFMAIADLLILIITITFCIFTKPWKTLKDGSHNYRVILACGFPFIIIFYMVVNVGDFIITKYDASSYFIKLFSLLLAGIGAISLLRYRRSFKKSITAAFLQGLFCLLLYFVILIICVNALSIK